MLRNTKSPTVRTPLSCICTVISGRRRNPFSSYSQCESEICATSLFLLSTLNLPLKSSSSSLTLNPQLVFYFSFRFPLLPPSLLLVTRHRRRHTRESQRLHLTTAHDNSLLLISPLLRLSRLSGTLPRSYYGLRSLFECSVQARLFL